MRILLSNDDGVFAKGIAVMYQHLSQSHDVVVIAPDRNCSGMSNALSLHQPLRMTQAENGFYAVNGTPSDCVQLGINSGTFDIFDLVVSGINDGPNLGDDTIYSGTVAAALEGRHLGLPAIAVSLCADKRAEQHYEFSSAAVMTCQLINKIIEHPLEAKQILNLNVPNLPLDKINGIKTTRCGNRHKAETMVQSTDPFGKKIYWYGKLGNEQDGGPGTDFHAVAEGYCSVSPLSTDMTVHQQIARIKPWLEK
ncbi:5'/3'-nucleotidase SurE [Glaciecola petra]|uniref:5'-nucleotidase SurE n=1 Tax=Glaciecola petra TaxID=3075602 RepID=A0ABU2ZKZ1_9ALTE|nr:5'/3'-nucleotidase SurE [Aestuariibacter sp. P117]MDT0593290.1 5'/3'-nucleotidase SurE [Aestuariibacter sp. P117]